MDYEPKDVRLKYTVKEKDQDVRKEHRLLLIVFYCMLSFVIRLLQLWDNLNHNLIFERVEEIVLSFLGLIGAVILVIQELNWRFTALSILSVDQVRPQRRQLKHCRIM